MPSPMPVIAVNSGCANGDSTPRSTNVKPTAKNPVVRLCSCPAEERPAEVEDVLGEREAEPDKPASTMPSTTPSNSRRRNSSTSSTAAPLAASSTHGATSTAVVSIPLPPPVRAMASRLAVFRSAAASAATVAPQKNAKNSRPRGSGS